MDELMRVAQLPIIEEHLRTQKDKWERMAKEAESMVCTADTLQDIKSMRSKMRKEFDEAEAQRKTIKQAIMARYNVFDAVYRDCITDAFSRADAALSSKVREVEDDIKRRCEDGLREYFAELCAVHHLDWLGYERVGIRVDMASAKAKTPKRLREQLTQFVVGVSEDVDRINLLEDADEIMIEYKKCLNAASAICTVHERHQRVESEKAARASRETVRAAEAEMVERVAQAASEYLDPPVIVPVTQDKDPKEIIEKCQFVIYDSPRRVIWEIRSILEREGIRYE